ncbi:MAG TPA: hypothetical protein GX728_04155 [Clostridiaceae bacterium]|nr:hypothetical protein [Clostridiaceae bacterium]
MAGAGNMPNRILKETICVSKDIASLSWFEEVFFYRLIVTVDDFGCYYASPPILKGKMFPRDSVTDAQIDKAMNTLSSLGIVRTYTVEDESYLEIVTWDKHQSRRAKNRKYPSFEESDEYRCMQMNADEIKCEQMNADACRKKDVEQNDEKCSLSGVKSFASKCKQMHANVPEESRNRGIEESIFEESYYCTERSDDHSVPEPSIVIELPLNDKTFHAVTKEDASKYRELYPAVNVEQELRNMLGWLDANPNKRKTRKGIKRFIANWLSKEQDRGGARSRAPTYRSSDKRDNRDNFTLDAAEQEFLVEARMPRLEGQP